MLRLVVCSVLAGVALLFFGSQARAVTILEIHDIGESGTTNDGTIFEAEPNPTSPSTGTGVFEPFVRIQGSGAALRGSESRGSRIPGARHELPGERPAESRAERGSHLAARQRRERSRDRGA